MTTAGEGAETLRAAAALMRERAEAAITPPWDVIAERSVQAFVDGYGPAMICEPIRKSDAEHIASWHPAVALAVADWLDFVAEGRESINGIAAALGNPPTASQMFSDMETHALAVARTYLGQQP